MKTAGCLKGRIGNDLVKSELVKVLSWNVCFAMAVLF
jgi:hypothetical protein